MRELLDEIFNNQPIDPVEAARRATQPKLRGRFYRDAAIAADQTGFAVQLDGRPVRTPGRKTLSAPAQELAEAIADEWRAQEEHIDPTSMPLTRLSNSIIDGVADAVGPVAADVAKYFPSDLVLYRASDPAGLVARQSAAWDPVVAWARDDLGAHFVLTRDFAIAAQHDSALAAARSAIPKDAWRLGAVHAVATLTGSALIALALLHGRLSVDAAWTAAHVDEDWNMEQWGRDELALGQRASRLAEMRAAARIIEALRSVPSA